MCHRKKHPVRKYTTQLSEFDNELLEIRNLITGPFLQTRNTISSNEKYDSIQWQTTFNDLSNSKNCPMTSVTFNHKRSRCLGATLRQRYIHHVWKNRTPAINVTQIHQFTTFTIIISGRERDDIQCWVDCGKKSLNWLRTSCMVSIATVATWHTRTMNLWADFEQCDWLIDWLIDL